MGVRQLIRWSLGECLPARYMVVRGRCASNACYLTFDDGPHPEHTPRLLDLMEEHSLKGTFFLVGNQVERYPQIVRRLVDEGHTVGNHTWSHAPPNRISARELLDETIRTSKLIAEVAGVTPKLFRPPHGKVTITKLCQVWRAKFTVVLWNVDPKDYSCNSADEAVGRIRSWQAQSGDVVLLHDVYAHTAESVKLLVDKARQDRRDIVFEPLSTLVPAYHAVHGLPN